MSEIRDMVGYTIDNQTVVERANVRGANGAAWWLMCRECKAQWWLRGTTIRYFADRKRPLLCRECGE